MTSGQVSIRTLLPIFFHIQTTFFGLKSPGKVKYMSDDENAAWLSIGLSTKIRQLFLNYLLLLKNNCLFIGNSIMPKYNHFFWIIYISSLRFSADTMLIPLIYFFRDLLLHFRLWLQCLLLKSRYSCKRTSVDVELVNNKPEYHRNQKKPAWVVQEIIRLQALMNYGGYRNVAYAFNRLHSQKREMTVSKSYVGSVTLKNKHAIYLKHRELK